MIKLQEVQSLINVVFIMSCELVEMLSWSKRELTQYTTVVNSNNSMSFEMVSFEALIGLICLSSHDLVILTCLFR